MKSRAAQSLADAIEAAATYSATAEPPSDPIDPDGPPLEVLRALLGATTRTIHRLAPDSPRLNPLHTNARAIAKAIAVLEKEAAGKETPDERTERLRREDGETRKKIEQYIIQLERRAARDGVCPHCGQPVL